MSCQIQSEISRFQPSIDLVSIAVLQKVSYLLVSHSTLLLFIEQKFSDHVDKFMSYTPQDIQNLELHYIKFLQLIAKHGKNQIIVCASVGNIYVWDLLVFRVNFNLIFFSYPFAQVPSIGIDLIWHTVSRFN